MVNEQGYISLKDYINQKYTSESLLEVTKSQETENAEPQGNIDRKNYHHKHSSS